MGHGLDATLMSAVAIGALERLERGDRLLLYSDGVIEARAGDGELWSGADARRMQA